jgi:formylglycine-generating enzyme required for sulfatase activity
MVQTDNPKDFVSMNRRAAISRADLLRVWYSAGRAGPDAAMWLANELGFEFVPPQPDPGGESSDIDFLLDPPTQSLAPPTRADVSPPAATAVESLWLPSKYLVRAKSNGDPQIETAKPVAKIVWTQRPVALPPIGLATWPEAKTCLRPILEPSRRSPSIDIDKLVDLMSQGRLLNKLPTETFYRLERTVYVVEDRSARLFPYHRDQQWLIDLLRFHLPRGYFSQLACNDPRTKVDPNRSIDEAISGLKNQEPQAGSQILVLGDLGILDTSWRLQGYWNEWIYEQARRDCRVSVMVPFPLDRVPSGFRDIAEFYSWQHSGVQSVLDRSRREELVSEILSRLSPASSFDPVLLRWVRQTVSEASDAALESFVWQDKSLDSNQYALAKNDRVESKKEFREAFRGMDVKTKRGVLRLLRESRAGLGEDPSVWFVELLSLTPEELGLVESNESDFEDVQRAIRYMDDHRGQQEIGGSIRSFLSWFSKRVESDGVWVSDPGISETVRRWQREFHPKRTLDARTRIGEIQTTGEASAEVITWLRASDDGLSIRRKSADQLSRGDSVLLRSTGRVLEIHGQEDRERAFWKSGVKPQWVSDYGTDTFGAWCEFQVPRHDGKGMVTQRMRWIKPGKFMMGSPENEEGRYNDESPLHSVTLNQGYWMADTQVTQELWIARSRGVNSSSFKGENNPVERISWEDCQDWIDSLSRFHKTLQLGLPTEAQWEYACRAGSQSAYCFGDDPKKLTKYGWFKENAKGTTHPVKQLQPNGWGLYDMHGNVWEWCSDWDGDYAASAQSDPTGPAKHAGRVVRGGGWPRPSRVLRSACRNWFDPYDRYDYLGFRLLGSSLEAEPSERAVLPVAEQGTEPARPVQVRVKDQETGLTDRFWKSGIKPTWVSDYGSDTYGLWCEFQVPRRDGKGMVEQRMRWIKLGEFMMGSPKGEKGRENESPQHPVTLTQGYWLADSQVTQELWTSIAGKNPSRFPGDTNPVEQISWSECQKWLQNVLKRVPTLNLSLPTEAQWEYACRAGSTSAYCFGDDPKELSKYGWFNENSRLKTHPVKQLQPNEWGLYDMHGNVWEWCSDWWGDYPANAQSDPTGPTKGTSRVLRGGSWPHPARSLRSACRLGYDRGSRYEDLGFRLLSSALGAEPSEPAMLPVAEQGTERARIGSAEPAYEFLRSVDLDATGDRTPQQEFSEMDVNTYASVRVVSDQEGYQFDRLEKPSWAVDFGSDQYGLYATFEVKQDNSRPKKKSVKEKIQDPIDVSKSVRQRMRWIPPGKFVMGSPEGKDFKRDDEGPQHEVIITRGYWMFDTPCTQGLWTALMGKNRSYFPDPERPVEQVRWVDAVGFAKKLNERLGKDHPSNSKGLVDGWDRLLFRLPTEAEWEYACRAGTTGDTYAGDLNLKSNDETKSEILDSIAWYGGNSGHKYDLEKSVEMMWLKDLQAEEKRGGTRKVAQKAPNPWGLYDMLGDVWEWCQDWYGDYPAEHVVDPTGPTGGPARVVRGGGWYSPARFMRSACRSWYDPGDRDYFLGFRLLSSAHQATESGEEASQSEEATRGRGTRPRGSDE